MLPVSRRYRFQQVKKSVIVDSGTHQTEMIYPGQPALREALSELEKLKPLRQKGQDLLRLIREEFQHPQEDIALCTQYIETLPGKLQS